MRQLLLVGIVVALNLSGCDAWVIRPAPYTIPTPLPTRTPSIYTPTPIILAPPFTATFSPATQTPLTQVPVTLTPANSPVSPTFTPTVRVNTKVLGCNTSIDISHGMGEVTNAYVTISNIGTSDLENVCATLDALDEGRPHPDKTECLASLPAGYQVSLKLTVDTTYKESTPIQVDVTSNNELLQRVGQASCTDIGLFPPGIDDLGTAKPNP